MGSNHDLSGERFGRLTVIKDSGRRTARKVIIWDCICDCGNNKYVPTDYLTSGDTRSCGCLFKEISRRPKNVRHGDATRSGKYARLYKTWISMKRRCDDPSDSNYKNYGGRGILVCDEWDTYENFRDWALSNGYDDSLTIDRIDVNGDYEPNNCRWADAVTQSNNRRSNHRLEYNGETHTIKEWSRITGLSDDTIGHRIKYGWTIEDTLTKAVRERRPSSMPIEYNGEVHTIAEWSRITGISYTALVQRFQKGWQVEDALTTPTRHITRNT